MIDPQELEAAGLYDRHAEDAEEQLALLRFLIEQGASLEEMVDARRRGRLAGLAGDRVIRPGREHLTLAEVANRAGIPFDFGERVWRASGFAHPPADARIFDETDVDTFRLFTAAAALMGEDVAMQLARVISSALARVAEAVFSAVSVSLDAPVIEAGANPLEAARTSAATGALLPQLSAAVDNLLRHHLELVNNRRFELAFPAPGSETADLAIGFADLAGSTALAERLSTSELAAALADFEARSSGIIGDHGGRVVKLIGDEVMFVADEAGAGAEILLALLDAFAAHEVLPPLRGGLAAGEVLARDGDYYGPIVNLAARAVGLAETNTAVVTDAVKQRLDHAGSDYRFVTRGRHRLKGIAGETPLWIVRRM
ncbi:MAG TPA: adenylate cyclase regulatory domain-containing protein [Solirubrobacteraceae bacterium]|jgi:class 3 adenylate cyclase|nr:adenylate cyclase regulatory domain-containing protein [Solirubrobacteraceae bacterium]